MASVETRKLGKHLFIFEKGKTKNANGKAKGRTLITSCQTDTDNSLPPEFIKYMRTLFDILDENKTGFVQLSDIEACWGHRNGIVQETGGVLEYLRKVTPSNGLLSFDRLCLGFSQALHSKEVVSIPNGSSRVSSERWKFLSNSGDSPAQVDLADKRTRIPVSEVQSDQQGGTGVALPHGIRESPIFGPNPKQNQKLEQKRPESMIVEFKPPGNLPRRRDSYDSSNRGSERGRESFDKNTFGRHEIEERNGSVLMPESSQPQKTGNLRSLSSKCNELNRVALESDSEFYLGGTYSKASRRGQSSPEIVTSSYVISNSYPSIKTDKRSESNFVKPETVFPQRPETRKRPKSMVPFSDQRQPADLSIAKKKGGILEGIQKTDKKAVVDKLKQWRSEQMKNGSRGGNDVTKTFQRTAHGYQSDNEGSYCRSRRVLAPATCTGNKLDFEHHCTTPSLFSKNGIRVPRTTVYYQGEIQNNPRVIDSVMIETIEETQEQNKTKDMENDKDDSSHMTDQLHSLKEGLRIVDEVRNCLVKQIAELQEHKLYEELNKSSLDNNRVKDTQSKTPAGTKNSGKTGIIFDSAHIESLSSHFKDLKTILNQAKQSRKDH